MPVRQSMLTSAGKLLPAFLRHLPLFNNIGTVFALVIVNKSTR